MSGGPAEHLYFFSIEGSDHGPYPGLAAPDRPGADLWAYCSPAFTRPVAEEIVRDLLTDDCGFTGRWKDGRLHFSWTPAYDGDGGTKSVEPDERGLYAIGGWWPWDYEGPSPVPESRRDAALGRSTTVVLGAASDPSPSPPLFVATSPAIGR